MDERPVRAVRRQKLARAVGFFLMVALFTTIGVATDRARRYDPPQREWTFVYYVAYDNNLSDFAPGILRDLRTGVTSPRTSVVLLLDRRGPGGLQRYVIDRGRMTVDSWDEEASADADTLGSLLAWSSEHLPAQHTALFMVGHGGRLDAASLDGHLSEGGAAWMSLHDFVHTVELWNEAQHEPLAALFLQQCGRGSLESYYELRHTADVLIASQAVMFAPNGYYTETLRSASRGELHTGEELARSILAQEPEEQLVSLTAVRSAALCELPEQLAPVIAPLVGHDHPSKLDVDRMVTFRHEEDRFADSVQLLAAAYDARGFLHAEVNAFHDWMNRELIIARRTGSADPRAAAWSGASLLLPVQHGARLRYWDLAIYRDTELLSLFDDIMVSSPDDAGDAVMISTVTVAGGVVRAE